MSCLSQFEGFSGLSSFVPVLLLLILIFPVYIVIGVFHRLATAVFFQRRPILSYFELHVQSVFGDFATSLLLTGNVLLRIGVSFYRSICDFLLRLVVLLPRSFNNQQFRDEQRAGEVMEELSIALCLIPI